ncbi:hypothetical protein IKH83_01685 [Candidatus Saccharibacteria bacterium]|nr:hypothetical protein [Candidatus Saccharibacteria bacterium]
MNRKKFLSILGLIVVIALTVAAYFVPDANAENGQTTITVTVANEKHPSVEITSPISDAEFLPSELVFSVNYEETDTLELVLEKGTESASFLPTITDPSGTFSEDDIDLSNVFTNIYGDYTFTVNASGDGNTADASIAFTVTPLRVTKNGHDDNGDPIIKIVVADDVEKIRIAVANPETGEPMFQVIEIDTADLGDGTVTLPFAANGMTSDNYTVDVTALGANDTELGTKNVDCNYEEPKDEDAPAVPDTGSFAGSLNVSKSDYILAGSIGLGVTIAIIILYATKRSNKRK